VWYDVLIFYSRVAKLWTPFVCSWNESEWVSIDWEVDRPLPVWMGVLRSTAGYKWVPCRWLQRPRRRQTTRPGVSRRTATRRHRDRCVAGRRRAFRVLVAPGRCQPVHHATSRTTTTPQTSWRRAKPTQNCTWNSSIDPPWHYVKYSSPSITHNLQLSINGYYIRDQTPTHALIRAPAPPTSQTLHYSRRAGDAGRR